jgi:uncharacterized membrane protein YccC
VLHVSSLPSDPVVALSRVAEELAGLSQQLARLNAENAALRGRLAQSEAVRVDLVAQMDHILEVLGDSRRQLNAIWQQKGPAPKA